MTEYKDEIIKKAEEEKEVLRLASVKANAAILDRNHLNYLDKLNIARWEKAIKEIEKTINSLKK